MAVLWCTDKPPGPGWYNAAANPSIFNSWRWWDGESWSQPAWPHFTAEQAAQIAQMKADPKDMIYWNYSRHLDDEVES